MASPSARTRSSRASKAPEGDVKPVLPIASGSARGSSAGGPSRSATPGSSALSPNPVAGTPAQGSANAGAAAAPTHARVDAQTAYRTSFHAFEAAKRQHALSLVASQSATGADAERLRWAETKVWYRWVETADYARTLTGMPDSIMLRVLSYLDLQSRKRLRLVSRNMSEMVQLNRQRDQMAGFEADKRRRVKLAAASKAARALPTFTSLPLEMLANIFAHCSLDDCQNWLTLDRRSAPIIAARRHEEVDVRDDATCDMYLAAAESDRALAARCRILKTDETNLWAMLQICKSLSRLDVDCQAGAGWNAHLDVALRMPTLRRMQLDVDGAQTAQFCRVMARLPDVQRSKLRSIAFGYDWPMEDDDTWADAAFNDTSMQFLWRANDQPIHWPAGLAAFALQKIVFQFRTGSFGNLTQNLPTTLRTLILDRVGFVRPAEMNAVIMRMVNFEHLKLGMCAGVVNDQHGMLDDSLPRLNKLKILNLSSGSTKAFPLTARGLRELPKTLIAYELVAGRDHVPLDCFVACVGVFGSTTLQFFSAKLLGFGGHLQDSMSTALGTKNARPFSEWKQSEELMHLYKV